MKTAEEISEIIQTSPTPYIEYDIDWSKDYELNSGRYYNHRIEYSDSGDFSWEEFVERIQGFKHRTLEHNLEALIPGVGVIEVVEDEGGEGQGDEYWFVLKITDGESVRFFRMDGYYASYDGGYYDGELKEVHPVERVVTFYE